MMSDKRKSYKVLIVDDVPKNIQILGNILARENYDIAYAQYGEQALSIVEKQKFDLILLDIMMPGMDGYDVCKILKNNINTRDIPIIFLTAKADMESVIKGFESGGQDYITKPFNALELLARVKTHIQLNEQRKRLREMNDNLEQLVDQRTKQLQEANKRLEVLDRAKTDFLSIISHELRTPLNGILGLTNLLKATDLNDEQKEYISFLKESSDRLKNFSEIALLITSLKTEKYEPDLLPVALNNIVEEAIFNLNESESNELPEIRVDTKGIIPLVMAESDLFKKCLVLVLQNAVKYSNYTKPVEIHIEEKTETVDITVEDYGPGFSKEAKEHLFELFASDDVMHNEGKGLSLAAVKLIMNIHGGDVSISNKEKGTGGLVKLSLKKA